MPEYIVKIKNHYLLWSTISDRPVTGAMTLVELKKHYRRKYGEDGIGDLDSRLRRVEEKGTSSIDDQSVYETISLNRAGPRETRLTMVEIEQAYCLRQPIRGGWLPE